MCSEWAVLCYYLGYARVKFYSIVPLSIVQPDDMWNPWVVQLFWYTWPLTLTWKPSSNPHGNLPASLIISATIAIKCQSSQLVFGRWSHTLHTLAPTENIICVHSENKPGLTMLDCVSKITFHLLPLHCTVPQDRLMVDDLWASGCKCEKLPA